MSYTKSYKNLKGFSKRHRALLDAAQFLGEKRYFEIMDTLEKYLGRIPTLTAIRFAAKSIALSGIHGYPATAMVITAIRNNRA